MSSKSLKDLPSKTIASTEAASVKGGAKLNKRAPRRSR